MTAGPHQFRPGEPAWYVHTDQGVVLAGPLPDEETARIRGNQVADELRASMRRDRYSERAVAERVRALRISRGVRQWPAGLFQATADA